MRTLVLRLLVAVLLVASAVQAQSTKKYGGPRPPKSDVPFLLQAGKLTEIESNMAAESQGKDGTVYTVPGATSTARTPMSEPIFLFLSGKINPDRLTLYKMDARTGNRVLTLPNPNKRKKDSARPLYLMVSALAPGLFRVEVNEYLENGEYCLSPEGSNQVFCFTTF